MWHSDGYEQYYSIVLSLDRDSHGDVASKESVDGSFSYSSYDKVIETPYV
jgi:hypothetical protein